MNKLSTSRKTIYKDIAIITRIPLPVINNITISKQRKDGKLATARHLAKSVPEA